MRPGDRVPLDGEVVEGESRLIPRLSPVSRFRFDVAAGDKATSGCVNTDGAIKLRVTHISLSMVQRILDSVENAARPASRRSTALSPVSPAFTPGCCCDCPADRHYPEPCYRRVAQVGLHRDDLVISCPCALVLGVSVPRPTSPASAQAPDAVSCSRAALLLEALNNVKTIVMDKTGTITKGNFVVQKVVPAQGVPLDENELLWLAAACEALPPTRSPSPSSTPTRSAKRPRQRPATFLLLPLVQRLRTSASRLAKAFPPSWKANHTLRQRKADGAQ